LFDIQKTGKSFKPLWGLIKANFVEGVNFILLDEF